MMYPRFFTALESFCHLVGMSHREVHYEAFFSRQSIITMQPGNPWRQCRQWLKVSAGQSSSFVSLGTVQSSTHPHHHNGGPFTLFVRFILVSGSLMFEWSLELMRWVVKSRQRFGSKVSSTVSARRSSSFLLVDGSALKCIMIFTTRQDIE
jgi:hypothetical protein